MSAGSTITAPCSFIAAMAASISASAAGCSRRQLPRRRRCARPAARPASRPPCSPAPRGRRPRRWPGSRGSTPAIAPSRIAASATVRAIGPAVSWLCAIGMMPARLTQADGRLDARRCRWRRTGRRSSRRSRCRRRRPRGWRRSRRRSPSWSRTDCGRARRDSSPARRVRSSRSTSCVERKFAHSLRLVLPRITAPASRSRSTTNASRGGDRRLRARASRRWSSSGRRCRCCP